MRRSFLILVFVITLGISPLLAQDFSAEEQGYIETVAGAVQNLYAQKSYQVVSGLYNLLESRMTHAANATGD